MSKKGKKVKQPAYQSAPNPQKVPFAEPENTGSQHPAWQFSIMDLDGREWLLERTKHGLILHSARNERKV